MKQNYSHISFILDKSGSMASIYNDTIGGFNTFLKSQKEAVGTATFSLTQFSNGSELTYSFVDIQSVPELSSENYRPSGGTALYDAIGLTINGCGSTLANLDESERPEKVIVVILTDGEENASKHFSFKRVQELIKEQTDTYNWEFVFLGANLDAEILGGSLGIKAGNSMTFAANSMGVNASYDAMSVKMSTYRSLSAQDAKAFDFFDASDKEAQKKVGA